MTQQARDHHYVPQWYQKRFLPAGLSKFLYLDLHPEIVTRNGFQYQRRALLHWGPAKCFFQKDLYTMKLDGWTSDDVERRFFGHIDRRGQRAVELFGNYNGYRWQ